MIPGIVALITDALGFFTIIFVKIGVIQDLAITASIGVACIIVSNILVLTLILSFFPILLTCDIDEKENLKQKFIYRVLTRAAGLTHGKNAYKVGIGSFSDQ